jgi:hypothetical protein
MRRRIKGALIAIFFFGLGGAVFQAVLQATVRGWPNDGSENLDVLNAWARTLTGLAQLIPPSWFLLIISFAAGSLVTLLIDEVPLGPEAEMATSPRPRARPPEPVTSCWCEINFETENLREIGLSSNVHDVFWTPFDSNRWFFYILFENYFSPRSHRIDFEGRTDSFASRIVHQTDRYCVILSKRIDTPVRVRVSVFGDEVDDASPRGRGPAPAVEDLLVAKTTSSSAE